MWLPHHQNTTSLKTKRLTNFGLAITNLSLAIVFGPMIGLLKTHPPSALEIFAAILTLDLLAYVFHRLFHENNFLFRFHQVHHSDPNIEATTALRFHFGEVLIANSARIFTASLLGFSFKTLIIFELVFLFFNLLEHSNLKLPSWLSKKAEFLFITPALHRRHHSIIPKEMNSNYGTIFSFWDRILKTRTPSLETDQFPMGLKPDEQEISLKQALVWPFKTK